MGGVGIQIITGALAKAKTKKKDKSPGWAYRARTQTHKHICPINQLAIASDDWNKDRNPRRDVAFSI